MPAADKRRTEIEAALRALSSETERRREEGGGTGAGAGLAELVAANGGAEPDRLEVIRPSLEDIYLGLVGETALQEEALA